MVPGHPQPPQRFRKPLYIAAAVALIAAAVVFVIVVHSQRTAAQAPRGPAESCVTVAGPPGTELHATPAPCDADPSFTVAALVDGAGNCSPPEGFQRFQPPFADAATAKLCLVPNLVVGHCYRFGQPVGQFDLVGCAGGGPAVMKVTQRLEVNDEHACPDGKLQFAMSYPSPPRTYCMAPPD